MIAFLLVMALGVPLNLWLGWWAQVALYVFVALPIFKFKVLDGD